MSIASLHVASGQYVFRAPEANLRSFIGWTCGRNEPKITFGKRDKEIVLMAAMAIGVTDLPESPLFESGKDMILAVGRDGIFNEVPVVDMNPASSHRLGTLRSGLVEWFVLTTRGLYLYYGNGDDAANYRGFFVAKEALESSSMTFFIGVLGDLADTLTRNGVSDNSLTAFRTVGMIDSLRKVNIKALKFTDILEARYPLDGDGKTSWNARYVMV